MKTIVEFQLLDHGIENSSYFQGCGVACTSFEDVATGIGNNAAEAVDDALESLAQRDWETEGMEKRILAEYLPGKRKLPTKPAVCHVRNDKGHWEWPEDTYYHVSIRVKGGDK